MMQLLILTIFLLRLSAITLTEIITWLAKKVERKELLFFVPEMFDKERMSRGVWLLRVLILKTTSRIKTIQDYLRELKPEKNLQK